MRYLAVLLAVLAFAGPAAATPKRALLASIATQTLQGSTIDDNYALGQCAENASTGVLHPVPCATHITGTGGTVTGTGATGSYVTNADGSLSLRTAAPRIGTQGLLVEQASTNGIRNNTMQGAAVGTPGTLPTNWSVINNTSSVTYAVSNLGTQNGIPFIDLTFSGSTSAAPFILAFDNTSGGIPAATAQTWTETFYASLVGGSLTNFSANNVQIDEYNSGSYVTAGANVFTLTANSFGSLRPSYTRLLNGGATVNTVVPCFRIDFAGGAVNATIRIGLPQVEQNGFATSAIPTTSTAVTRSADVVTLAGAAASAALANPFSVRVGSYNLANPTTLSRLIYWGTGGANLAPNSSNTQLYFTDGGVTATPIGTAGYITVSRSLGAYSAPNIYGALNGTATTAGGGGAATNTGTVYLGSQSGASNFANGYLSRLTLWPYALPSAVMQSLSAQ